MIIEFCIPNSDTANYREGMVVKMIVEKVKFDDWLVPSVWKSECLAIGIENLGYSLYTKDAVFSA